MSNFMPMGLFLIAFLSVVIGAIVAGSIIVTFILLLLFVLVSAGILSASILVGLYKRSVAVGFKTLLMLICSLGGIVAGAGSFWLLNRIMHYVTPLTATLLGVVSGLVGGLLLGIVLFGLIRSFLEYCRQKLSLRL
jgi:hypothetical protein